MTYWAVSLSVIAAPLSPMETPRSVSTLRTARDSLLSGVSYDCNGFDVVHAARLPAVIKAVSVRDREFIRYEKKTCYFTSACE